MAERDYKRGEGITPIQEMTTRQLRKYIRERAEEAQERLTSIQNDKRLNIEDMSRAFQDQLSYVQNFGHGRSGGIMKDTSRMSKEQMAEYAYAIRDLNMLDTESKYARDLDYKENKERYQKFIEERLKSSKAEDREYWSKFVTEKGNIKKSGYKEYKEFINFLKAIEEVQASYGYETIKDKYYDEKDQVKREEVASLLLEVYNENKGSGLSMAQLVEKFNEKYEDLRKPIPKTPEAPKRSTTKKLKTAKSKQNIKTKTAGKMKNGSVREKPTTEKL